MRREAVVAAMPGEERDPLPRHLADEDGLARVAKRGVNRDLAGVCQEFIEAGATYDGDVRDRLHRRYATFSLLLLAVPALAVDPVDAGAALSALSVPDEELDSGEEDVELAGPVSGDAAEPDAADAVEPLPLRLSVR